MAAIEDKLSDLDLLPKDVAEVDVAIAVDAQASLNRWAKTFAKERDGLDPKEAACGVLLGDEEAAVFGGRADDIAKLRAADEEAGRVDIAFAVCCDFGWKVDLCTASADDVFFAK